MKTVSIMVLVATNSVGQASSVCGRVDTVTRKELKDKIDLLMSGQKSYYVSVVDLPVPEDEIFPTCYRRL